MKKVKNIIYIISIIIIIAGIISVAMWGFNYGMNYVEAQRINIYIGKECKIEDIKQITDEVLGKDSKIYQKIEKFEDTVSITVKSITDEQKKELNTKLKEKYSLENEEVVTTTNIPHQMLRDIVKPYIMPLIITTIAVWLCMLIVLLIAKSENTITKSIMAFVNLVLAEAVYASIFAITRLPINEFFLIGILAIYICVIVCSFKFKINMQKEDKK